ncbi:MAG: prepilin-type N-terminal cleavage/methylation domain-containing protein [Chitinispirillaceae bacterium]|nr:prepilin-type N-terminal cleavage/methylation domain-containing protein [Chitinispirillaceae bacterium]
MGLTKGRTEGFTLVEILIAIGISSLVLVMLTRLFSVSLKSYSHQEQLAEMNQNARYTIRELSDILMQAGADLQIVNLDTLDKDIIIETDGGEAGCSGFTIKINPRGGIYQIPQTIGVPVPICTIQVDNARGFMHADSMQRIPAMGSDLPLKFYRLLNVNTQTNSLSFAPADSFNKNDAICSFATKRFFLDGTNLCCNNAENVIAENIDSLSIVFMDRNGDPEASWKKMRSVRILVRAKTALPDPRYDEYADHCRRVTLTYEFRLRNKVEL